jgi:prophage regulatory protein
MKNDTQKTAPSSTFQVNSILRRPQLEQKIGLSRSAIYDRINPDSPRYDAEFPRPITMGSGKNPPIGWHSAEIDAWINSRPRLATKP